MAGAAVHGERSKDGRDSRDVDVGARSVLSSSLFGRECSRCPAQSLGLLIALPLGPKAR